MAVGRHFHRSAIYSKESISRIRGIERSIQNDASRKISAESRNLGNQNKSLGISGSLHVEPSLEVSNFYNLDLRISKIAPDIKLLARSSQFNEQAKQVLKSISVCSDT